MVGSKSHVKKAENSLFPRGVKDGNDFGVLQEVDVVNLPGHNLRPVVVESFHHARLERKVLAVAAHEERRRHRLFLLTNQ